MVDRYRVWLGAGVLAGGVSAAMLAGAGVAAAEDGTSSSSGAQASDAQASGDQGSRTPTTSRTDDADDSAKEDSPTSGNDAESTDSDDADSDTPPSSAETDSDESSSEDTDSADTDEESDGAPARSSSGGRHRAPEPEAETVAETESVTEAPTAEAQPEPATTDQAPAAEQPAETVVDAAAESPLPSLFVESIETDLGSENGALVMRTAAAEEPPLDTGPRQVLDFFNNIGTAFYNFYTNTLHNLAGPVRVPFGSSVRVESSTLTIGDGKVVPADWYFPSSDEPPTGLIYLQHGFLAGPSFYSATAAYLAEKTNSVVVAPTLTWNLFDIENYPLEWPTTSRAIADLFTGDRAALTASAQAAGYVGTLPTRVVLAGHSAGGGMVVMVARFMAELGIEGNLAGVVMFDGAGTLSPMTQDLLMIPRSIPVYNIAAEPSSWNLYGDASRRLALVRPGMFTGVKIKGGHHSDAMQTTSMAVQLVAYLGTGFSSPLDIMANKVLATGWINDMFAGTRTAGLYNGDGSARDIVFGWWWRQLNTRAAIRAV